jgi:hypothetical protein
MFEVGWVRFGRRALDVAQATVPRFRTVFSKPPSWCGTYTTTRKAALVELAGRDRAGAAAHFGAVSTCEALGSDCANLPGLVAQAHAYTPIGGVLADAQSDSEHHHAVRQQLSFCERHPCQARSKDVGYSRRSHPHAR